MTTTDQATDPIPELTKTETETKKIIPSYLRKTVDKEEMERKLKERMPIQYQSDFKNSKIDSKALLHQSLPQKLIKQSQIKETITKSPPLKLDTRNILKRPGKKIKSPRQRKALATKEIKLNTDSRLPLLVGDEDSAQQRKKSSTHGAGRTVKKNRSLKKGTSKGSEEEDEEFDEESEEEKFESEIKLKYKNGETLEVKDLSPKYKQTNTKTQKDTEEVAKLKIIQKSNLPPIVGDTFDLRNIESVEPLDDRESGRSHDSKTKSKTTTDLSQPFQSASDNWNLFSNKKKNEIPEKSTKFIRIQYTEAELNQINNLFSYFYGFNGPPKRIRSANYAVLKSDYYKKDSEKTEIVKIDKIIEKKQESNKTVINYFDNMLEKFEQKRNQLNDRVKSAQIRRENLQEESLKKWSASIEKKSTNNKPIKYDNGFNESSIDSKLRSTNIKLIDITYGNRSLFNRKIKSATILRRPKSSKKRPKSVTFTDEINDSKINNNKSESEIIKQNVDESVLMQPPYLISAIEMEEILEAASLRATMRSRSRSSVTTIPKIYLNHLQNIQNRIPTQKQPNDNMQESLEHFLTTTSGTDTSDELISESENYYLSLNQFERLGSSKTNLNSKIASSTLTFESQNKQRNSSAKNQRINSRSGGSSAKVNIFDEFETLSNYRLVLLN